MASLRLATFISLFSLCYFIYTITFTYVLGVNRSMKGHFRIGDCGIGWLYAAVGIGYAVTVILAAYFGGRRRRTYWIGGGFVLVALGCLALVIGAFVAPLPEVRDPQEERELWKDAFYRLTMDDIANSRKLAATYWGQRIPENYRQDLINSNYNLSTINVNHASSSAREKRWIKDESELFDGFVERVRRHLEHYPQEEVGESFMSEHRLVKRQLPTHEFPDPLKDRLKKKFEESVTLFVLGWDSYDRFANSIYNMTRDPEIYERMMLAARLPFGYCRNSSSIVRGNIKRAECERKLTGGHVGGLIFALIGLVLIGVGSTTIWTVGAPLLDDEIGKFNLALCLGGIFGLQALGFIIGVVLGLFFEFKLYLNFNPPKGLIALDPRWIGAWWLGFLIISVSLIIPALLVAFCAEQRRNSRTPPGANDQSLMRARVGGENYGKWNGIIASIFRACRPPIFVALLLALTFDALALKGYFDFLPKFYENNYSPSILKSALPFWIFSIGIILGGIVFRLAKLDGRKAAFYMFICALLAAIFSLAQSVPSFSCNNVVRRLQLAGLSNSTNGHPKWPSCLGCMCDSAEFYPVCADNPDSTPFYSPCQAGCTNFTHKIVRTSVEFHFDYCFCATPEPEGRIRVSRDSCKDDCSTATNVYVILSSLAALLSGSIIVPAILFLLRISAYELRSLALGVIGLSVCVFGILPSALLYRFVADSTCFSWRTWCPASAGQNPVCEIFDGPLLRERLHLFLGILRLVSVFFYGLVIYHASGVKLYSVNQEMIGETELYETKSDDIKNSLTEKA